MSRFLKASELRTWGFPYRLRDGASVAVMRDVVSEANPYAGGYGHKIPTEYRVRLADNKVRRVYASRYANAARLWVSVCGDDCTLDIDTECALDALEPGEQALVQHEVIDTP
jgi:hypothetical protein